VLWNMNPDDDDVSFYSVKLDNKLIHTVTSDNCDAVIRTCSAPIIISDTRSHSISVTATNQFGTSKPTTIKFRLEKESGK